MSALDSRFLTYLDCFGQRFPAVGQVRYAVTSPTAACLTLDEKPFVIEVGEKRDEGPQQHNVEVQYRGGAFTVTPSKLAIAAGDVVLWHASLATTPPFAVWGDQADGPFSSMALRQAAFYSHAFGATGEFRWRDANNGGVEGVVRVRGIDSNDRDACDRWRKELQAGAVVAIDGDRVEPRDLEIVAGQTVFFAVSGSRGLTITEDTLAVPVVTDHHMTGSQD